MQEYEITYLVENEQVFGKKIVEHAIESLEGEIVSVKPWGQRNLAYKIGKLNTAFYTTVVFKMQAELVKKLNRALRLERELVRYLIVRGSQEINEEPEQEKPAQKPVARPVANKVIEVKTPTKKPTAKEVEKEVAKIVAEKPTEKKETKKTTTKKPASKPADKKPKDAVSDADRLKQLENKLQDLLKE